MKNVRYKPLALAVFATSSFLLIGCDKVTRLLEDRSASGTVAAKWLDDAFDRDWKRNPFPANSILKVTGRKDTSESVDYWFRVDFKPGAALQLIANIHSDILKDKVNPIAITTHLKGKWYGVPLDAPKFYRPWAQGPGKIWIEVVKTNGSTGTMVESFSIWISKKKGIAYIRTIRL